MPHERYHLTSIPAAVMSVLRYSWLADRPLLNFGGADTGSLPDSDAGFSLHEIQDITR